MKTRTHCLFAIFVAASWQSAEFLSAKVSGALPRRRYAMLIALAMLSTFNLQLSTASAQDTAFSYQGRLNVGGAPANGSYDLAFTLYDSTNVPGNVIAGPVTNSAVSVTNGLFTTTVDFGNVFTGGSNWLQIAVSTNGANAFSPLSLRQQLTPVPYAEFASSVSGLNIQPNGTSPNVILGYSGNHLVGGVFGTAIGGGGAAGLTNSVVGNFGTIGGGEGNTVGTGAFVGGGEHNQATTTATTVGGGVGNTASGIYAFVGGGEANTAGGNFSMAGGGYNNTASGSGAFIGGGQDNSAGNLVATVSGGNLNNASGDTATIGGGSGNSASGEYSTVGGGADNTASGNASVVAGGVSNQATNSYATVGGGYNNVAGDLDATVGGGTGNTANAPNATVSGGTGNTANGGDATVSGGSGNTAGGGDATVAGGFGNIANGNLATVAGGAGNNASGTFSFAAGHNAQATNDGAFVWADSQFANFYSTNNDSFNVRAAGGARFVTSGAGLTVDGPMAATRLRSPGAGINTGTYAFIQRAVSTNVSGNTTLIYNPITDNDPNAILIVTHNWTADTNSTTQYNTTPVGVYYNGTHWAIFNEDVSFMALGRAFNVLVIKP